MTIDSFRKLMRLPLVYACCALALTLSGCAGAVNYADQEGPRYASTAVRTVTCDERELRVVSFNVKFAEHVDRAIKAMRTDPDLRNADIVLLQEMDARGTAAMADSLAMDWVYYPASVARNGRDFGNAILSCWPLEDDDKILLPHRAWVRGNQRIAVAATVRIGGRAIRIYSVHLATAFGNRQQARREQIAAVLDDADRHPDVILGGDFNSATIPEAALARGYTWPTRGLPPTVKVWTLDHILLKGSPATASTRAGVVKNNLNASDHRPVWIALSLDPRQGTASGGW